MRFLIVGTGYTGHRMASILYGSSEHSVIGTSRSVDDPSTTYELYSFDLENPAVIHSLLEEISVSSEHPVHLVFTAGPPRRESQRESLELLDGFLRELPLDCLEGFTYLSSTSVYGDANGNWVDETDPLEPISRSGHLKVESEDLLETRLAGSVPLIRARPGGIYGPGRNGFQRYLDEDYELVDGGKKWTNRIHVEDLARSLIHLAEKGESGTFNVVDGNPVRLGKLVRFVHEQAGRNPDEIRSIPWEVAEQKYSEMKLGLLKPNKRVSSKKLKQTGYTFRYPTVYDGLREILDSSSDETFSPS